MENKYPFLFSWKQNGFDKFPPYPIQAILKKRFNKGFEKAKRDPAWVFIGQLTGLNKALEDIRKESGYLIGADFALDRLKEKRTDRLVELGKSVFEAQKEFNEGNRKRQVIAKDLIKKILPSAQGGKIPLNKNRRFILKQNYREMKDYIKEVRMWLEIPLKKTPGYKYELIEKNPEDFISRVPGILDIFKKEEFPLLIRWPSIRKTCLKIISERLPQSISPRTLKDAISQI